MIKLVITVWLVGFGLGCLIIWLLIVLMINAVCDLRIMLAISWLNKFLTDDRLSLLACNME